MARNRGQRPPAQVSGEATGSGAGAGGGGGPEDYDDDTVGGGGAVRPTPEQTHPDTGGDARNHGSH